MPGCHRPPATADGPPEAAPAPLPGWFADVTAASGVNAVYRNGQETGHFAVVEATGGGVALFDFDGDGLLDLFATGGGYFEGKEIHGHPGQLYRNRGGWNFEDVTQAVGLDGPRFYTHGCAVADYDRDGWPDLLVTGWGRLALYHNEPASEPGALAPGGPRRPARRFVEVSSQAGLPRGLWSTGAAWGDLDGDGWPDLYVCQYLDWSFADKHPFCKGFDRKRQDLCPPAEFQALPHHLFRNNGDGTFADVSMSAGLHVQPGQEYGKGLGVVIADLTGDAKPDVYVANDTTDNFLYVNRSTPGTIRLREMGLEAGAARDHTGRPNGSMGVAVGDYDGSGRPSLFVTNYEDELHALYRNDSRTPDRPLFRYATQVAGLAVLGTSFVGWGTGFLDLDHDGWEDLVFVNGHPNFYPRGTATREQRPVLFLNQGNGRFVDGSSRCGPYFQAKHHSRGLGLGDLDNDGRIDLVVSHLNEPVALLRNVRETRHRWLGVELVGRGYRDVAGARLTVEVNGRKLTRFAVGGGSFLSAGDPRHVFGLVLADGIDRLTVEWPWGQKQEWKGLTAGHWWRLEEGKKDAARKP